MYIWTSERVKVKRVVDGDTVDFELDLGFRLSIQIRTRLARLDAPEIRGHDREKGLITKKFVEDFLKDTKDIKVVTHKRGKYGRYLADIWKGNEHLNKILIEKGLAKVYTGGK